MLENQIPQPPVDMVMPAANAIVSVATWVVYILFAAWIARECWRTKSPTLMLIFLGGTVAVLLEPLLDYTGGIWWPQYGHTPAFRAYNRAIPSWLVPAYGIYIGGLSALLYRRMRSGLTVKQLWTAYFAFWGVNLLLELPALSLGVYVYYGDQPFKVLGFPFCWAVANVCMVFMVAAVLFSYQSFLTGLRSLLILVLVPTISTGAEFAASWPVWMAINSAAGPATKVVAGLVTMGIAILVVYMVTLKVCTDINTAERHVRDAA